MKASSHLCIRFPVRQKKNNLTKIYFLLPYPVGNAASQRFRMEQYFNVLKEKGFHIEVSSFIDARGWKYLYTKGHFFEKTGALIRGYFRRCSDLWKIRKVDFVFIHREAAPFGPPVFEFIIAKLLGKKIIFDFDDAIWIPNYSEHNSFVSWLKRYNNVFTVSRMAYKVSCGNDYLCRFARKLSKGVVYNPTTLDTFSQHNQIKLHNNNEFVIGWTGTHSTLPYLNDLIPLLEELERKFRFTFLVICDQKPDYKLKSFEFRYWRKETEISDLLSINLGLMPLPDDKWAKGKCGFKALQYNALCIPALVTPIGVNAEIIQDYVNGFVCHSLEDWKKYLIMLLNNRDLLARLGKFSRPLVENHFSVRSNSDNFLQLFS